MRIFKFKKIKFLKEIFSKSKKYPMYLFLIYRYVICSNLNEDIINPLLKLSRNLDNKEENIKVLTIKKFIELKEMLEESIKVEPSCHHKIPSKYFYKILNHKNIHSKMLFEDFIKILIDRYEQFIYFKDRIILHRKFEKDLIEFFNSEEFNLYPKIKNKFILKLKEALEEIENIKDI